MMFIIEKIVIENGHKSTVYILVEALNLTRDYLS